MTAIVGEIQIVPVQARTVVLLNDDGSFEIVRVGAMRPMTVDAGVSNDVQRAMRIVLHWARRIATMARMNGGIETMADPGETTAVFAEPSGMLAMHVNDRGDYATLRLGNNGGAHLAEPELGRIESIERMVSDLHSARFVPEGTE